MPATLDTELEMGRVTAHAKIENLEDVMMVRAGKLDPSAVRSVEVADALIDTGCTVMGLPKRYIEQLGLNLIRTKNTVAATGMTEARIFGTVRLTVQDRDCPLDVMELPDECPVIIGQIPLEYFDFVVDLRERKLIGNPAHNGEQIYEML